MAARDVLTLNESTPQIVVPQVGDTYNMPRALTIGIGTITTAITVADLSATWNAGGVTFTGIKANITNTASASASLLMDLQVGGTSMVKFDKGGEAIFAASLSGSSQALRIYGDTNNVRVGATGTSASLNLHATTYVNVAVGSSNFVGFGSTSASAPSTGAALSFSSQPGFKLGRAPLSGGQNTTGYFLFDVEAHVDEKDVSGWKFVGQSAYASAATKITGGNVVFVGGDGASGSGGVANGGNVTLDGGTGYGTGTKGSVIVQSTTATPAGGSTVARLLFGTTAGFGIYYGSGAPTVSAAKGSLYLRSDGSTTNDRMYVNTNGTTTWTAVTTVA